MLALAVAKDYSTRGEAMRALANFAANTEVQPMILDQGGLSSMIECLHLDDMLCKRYGALAIGKF